MTTLAEFMIVAGADNRPPMLDKPMYESWKGRMELYIQGKDHGCTSLSKQERECKLYDEFDKFSHVKGETLFPDPHALVANFHQPLSHSNNYPSPYTTPRYQQQLSSTTQHVYSSPPQSNPMAHESTFANPKYLKKAQSDKPRLYEIPYDTSDPANRFCPNGEDTVTLEKESRSKLDKDTTIVQLILFNVDSGCTKQFKPRSSMFKRCLAVLTFIPGDDPIACMNKAMAFLSAVFSPRYPSTNNQLRSSSNPRNQATVQDGRVTVQQVKQKFLSAIIVKVKGTWLDNVLNQRGEGMQHDPGVADGQVAQIITHNATFQTDDLDAYDSDYDDISSAKAILMANLSSCDSDVLSEDKANNNSKIVNESLIAELERYKERVKILEQIFNVDLSSREKFIDSQMDDMIRMKNTKFAAFETKIDTVKQTLSKHVKEKESLLTTLNGFKTEFKQRESKSIDKQIILENKNKELKNMVSQHIKTTLYDGNVLSKIHDAIPMVDEEETLILAEESRLKMVEKQNDPIMKKEKINITPINYSELNKLAEDFGKRFVPQQELFTEQIFWLQSSNKNSEEPGTSNMAVKIEVPSELPKVSLVNKSLKKLRFHLASFEKVVKVRTTPDAINKGSWDFEHTKKVFLTEIIPWLNMLKEFFQEFDKGPLDEITEVQTIFTQIEAVVEQCSIDRKCCEIQQT
ncbi:hypothetical protein Tco_0470799 [Tanacetum coccineum]